MPEKVLIAHRFPKSQMVRLGQRFELIDPAGKKLTDTPTAERILKAFPDMSLTILKTVAGEEILRWLTPLSALQQDILHRLGLATSLYRQLEIQNSGN